MLPVIYQTKKGAETDFEFQFNENVLFRSFHHENFFDDKSFNMVRDNAIVVYSSNSLKVSAAFLQYISKFKDVVLFHCSNESLNHFSSYYTKAKAVLRSGGWNPNIKNAKVYSVPLAYQSEFVNTNPENVVLKDREFVWCFFGSLKGDRIKMYDELKRFDNFFYFQSKGWMDPENKTPEQVIEFYKKMIFIPSPVGNIYFECNRTLDALEWGGIPVTTKFLGEDCYRYIYGDHPFIVGENWKDAATQMEELMSDPDRLLQKQIEVREWYLQFKEQLANDVFKIVSGKFDQLEGKQFYYQKLARKNSKLKWRFFKHFTLEVYLNRILGRVPNSKKN